LIRLLPCRSPLASPAMM